MQPEKMFSPSFNLLSIIYSTYLNREAIQVQYMNTDCVSDETKCDYTLPLPRVSHWDKSARNVTLPQLSEILTFLRKSKIFLCSVRKI